MTPPNSPSLLAPSSISASIDQASFSNPDSNGSLSITMDALVGGFQEQATDGRTFVAVTAAGMAYRAGTLGTMSLGVFRGIPLLSRSLPVAVGLGSEVTAFEIVNRALAGARFPRPGGETPPLQENPNFWRWNGQGGLRQGLLSSFITFGTLRGAGSLAHSENFVVQHLLQDSAMVLGHNVSGVLGITPSPTGSLAEQFFHAEAVNLQIGAGMAVGHGLAPGLHVLERGLDLSLQFREVLPTPSRLSQGTRGFFRERLGPLFASAAGLATFLIPEIARASVGSSAAESHFSTLLAGFGLAGAGILAMAIGGGDSPEGPPQGAESRWLTLAQAASEGDGEALYDLLVEAQSGNFEPIEILTGLAEAEDTSPDQSSAFLKVVRWLYEAEQEKVIKRLGEHLGRAAEFFNNNWDGRSRPPEPEVPIHQFPDPFQDRQMTPLLRKAVSNTQILTELQLLQEFSGHLIQFLESDPGYFEFMDLAGHDLRVLNFLTFVISHLDIDELKSAPDSRVEIMSQLDFEDLWGRIQSSNRPVEEQYDYVDTIWVLAYEQGNVSAINFLRTFAPTLEVWEHINEIGPNHLTEYLIDIGNPFVPALDKIVFGGDPSSSDPNEEAETDD